MGHQLDWSGANLFDREELLGRFWGHDRELHKHLVSTSSTLKTAHDKVDEAWDKKDWAELEEALICLNDEALKVLSYTLNLEVKGILEALYADRIAAIGESISQLRDKCLKLDGELKTLLCELE